MYAVSVRQSEAKLSMHLIPSKVFKGIEIQNHPK